MEAKAKTIDGFYKLLVTVIIITSGPHAYSGQETGFRNMCLSPDNSRVYLRGNSFEVDVPTVGEYVSKIHEINAKLDAKATSSSVGALDGRIGNVENYASRIDSKIDNSISALDTKLSNNITTLKREVLAKIAKIPNDLLSEEIIFKNLETYIQKVIESKRDEIERGVLKKFNCQVNQ